VISVYLAEVTAGLTGPARTRSGIVAELRGGLLDAAAAYESAGLSPPEAEAAAIADFGDSRQVAEAFRPELAARRARRTAVRLIGTAPLVAALWAAAALTSRIGAGNGSPWRWTGLPEASRAAVPAIAIAVAISAATALLTVAATGRLGRRIRAPGLAPTAATIASFGVTAADAIILGLFATQLVMAPGTLAPVPAAAAVAASLLRLTLARSAGRRCLADRTALTSNV